MKELAKRFKTAKIFFHKDLDGITSAISIKAYLQDYGIKIVDAEPLNYGAEEYSVRKTKKNVMNVLVDFAHGKPMMNIHLDHHDGQVGFDKATQSVKFDKTPSNVQAIQDFISIKNIFPSRDIKIISKVDSADFARFGLTPDDIIRATFQADSNLKVSKNHEMMGLVVNKLTLSFKNKKEFLSKLVMMSKPSLLNMYINTVKLAKAEGYKTPKEIEKDSANYLNQRINKSLPPGKPADIKKGHKTGESFMIGTMIYQYGGGAMGKGNQYDRYTIFKVYPDAEYLLTVWPMGLVQLAKNPFKSGANKYHLGDVAKKAMKKFQSKWKGVDVSLDYLKYTFERDIVKKGIADAAGFTWADFEALFKNQMRGVKADVKGWWPDMVKDVSSKSYGDLSPKQRGILKKVTVNAWDIIQASSGGHKDITNMSGFNFLGKGYIPTMLDLATEIAKDMKNKRLE
jgi:hypothetical protein